MPAPYNVVPASAKGNLYDLFSFLNNDSTGGLFMPLMLMSIWLISFIGSVSEGRQASRAFIFSSFISAILAILLALIGLLNPQYMYFLFLMVGAGLIWYKLDNAPGI